MFTKALLVAFLSLTLSVSAAPAASTECTVTITARATSPTLSKSSGASSIGSVGGSTDVATGTSSNTGSNDNNLQTSLTLDPSLVNTGFEQNGQAEGDPEGAGQVPSNTSVNNFINFCATVSLPLTNGTQIKSGSCNAAPMGVIPATTAMPSAKFVNPKNLDTIAANTNFTIQMAIQNLDTGNFVNPDTNYFAAPQTINGQGLIVGHSHVVIEAISSLTTTTPTNPQVFAFFKGLNDVAVNGILSTTVDGGLPAGVYRMASINAAANHQPALVAVAQHGSLDDMVYFTVSDNGASTSSTSSTGSTSSADSTSSSASASASSAVASNSASNTKGGANGDKGANGNTSSSSAAASQSSATASSKTGANGNTSKSSSAGSAAASGAAGNSKTDTTTGKTSGFSGFGGFGGRGKRMLSRM
ncbi:uncharacterized protein FIBRA_03025 [Fibroporia radiculosa]|uniref:Uncharacterized protein n=1 Tax=Fibroporia radiculosa TaxID=599839 RepID=J4HVR6_9APHY|nr:uncharacterized protein FIBRA_03025 [Fibroporia radiculosa]CCM00977.1 predicted protein [Fibroporia radiculosa]